MSHKRFDGQLAPDRQSLDISVQLYNGGTLYSVTFPDGLEGITLTYPERQSTTQALGGAWIDALGQGIRTVTISGHTGWNVKGGLDGREVFARLVELHRQHVLACADDPNNRVNMILFNDPGSMLTLRLLATTLRVTRDHSQPLLFQFSYDLQVIEVVARPAAQGTARQNEASPPPLHRQTRTQHARHLQSQARTSAPLKATRYTVKNGDTLDSIANMAYSPTNATQRAAYIQGLRAWPGNERLRYTAQLIAGQTVLLPEKVY